MIILLPCIVIIMLEILKIIKVLGADKKSRAQKELEQKDSELEELRQRLAQLEKGIKGEDATPQSGDGDPVNTENKE